MLMDLSINKEYLAGKFTKAYIENDFFYVKKYI